MTLISEWFKHFVYLDLKHSCDLDQISRIQFDDHVDTEALNVMCSLVQFVQNNGC